MVDLVTKETCDYIIRSTAAHIRRCEKGQGETWRTLYSYTKMDLPCCEIKSVQYHTDRIMRLVAKIIGDVFEERKAAASLHARSWKEPHLLRYQVVEGQPVHRGVELHHDGSHFTWQLMLSDENDYVGTISNTSRQRCCIMLADLALFFLCETRGWDILSMPPKNHPTQKGSSARASGRALPQRHRYRRRS